MRYIPELYFSGIYEKKDLSDSDFFSLYYFATNKKLSTYQLTKFLSITKFKMEYKNVHKKVKKLYSVQLIEEVKEKSIQTHSAIFYQLSDIGVYYIFENLYERCSLFKNEQIIEIIHGLVNYYGENDFLIVFINSFFNKKTLLNLKSEIIIGYFLNYCKKCCFNVNLKLFSWDSFFYNTPILRWSYLFNYAIDELSKNKVQVWLMDIKRRFQWQEYTENKNCLDWIDSDISLNSEDDNTIIITKNENTLILKIDKYQKTLSFLFNKKNILQFEILAKDDDYIVNKSDILEKHEYLTKSNLFDFMHYRKIYLEESMVLPVISSGKFRDTNMEYWKKIEQDIINLINDEKFYWMVVKTMKEFEKGGVNILKYKV